jgi:hypothetical protein
MVYVQAIRHTTEYILSGGASALSSSHHILCLFPLALTTSILWNKFLRKQPSKWYHQASHQWSLSLRHHTNLQPLATPLRQARHILILQDQAVTAMSFPPTKTSLHLKTPFLAPTNEDSQRTQRISRDNYYNKIELLFPNMRNNPNYSLADCNGYSTWLLRRRERHPNPSDNLLACRL